MILAILRRRKYIKELINATTKNRVKAKSEWKKVDYDLMTEANLLVVFARDFELRKNFNNFWRELIEEDIKIFRKKFLNSKNFEENILKWIKKLPKNEKGLYRESFGAVKEKFCR